MKRAVFPLHSRTVSAQRLWHTGLWCVLRTCSSAGPAMANPWHWWHELQQSWQWAPGKLSCQNTQESLAKGWEQKCFEKYASTRQDQTAELLAEHFLTKRRKPSSLCHTSLQNGSSSSIQGFLKGQSQNLQLPSKPASLWSCWHRTALSKEMATSSIGFGCNVLSA